MAETGVEQTIATRWREVDEWIHDTGFARVPGQPRSTAVFRGLASPGHTLDSSLHRRGPEYASRERHLLRNFRKYGYRYGRRGWSDWEWLALAQHHGLPTRLLDFTFSPEIALHFATVRFPDRPGIVWSVDYGRLHEAVPEQLQRRREREGALVFTADMLDRVAPGLGRFDRLGAERPFAVFFEPPSIEERMVNQSAVLCAVAGDSTLRQIVEDLPGTARRLVIEPALKAEVRDRLDLEGITERMLFPGLAGLAAWLSRYYADLPIEPPPEDRGQATHF